jgi:YVTN family beta-propeller protein
METLMIYKISPNPSFPKRGIKKIIHRKLCRSQKKYRRFLFPFYFLLFTLLVDCTAIQDRSDPSELYKDKGQITLFLNGPEKASLDVTFDLISVAVIAEDGIQREVMNTPLTINSHAATGRQILLGERSLPEGRYKKLRLFIKEALFKRKERVANLALPPEGIEVTININVKRRQNIVLFLNWNADGSVVDGYLFSPVFAVRGQIPELGTLLIYVTNEFSNNVSVINRESAEVVATILVGKRPRGIAAGQRRQRLRVYVANSGSDDISVIDPTINKVENVIPIRFGKKPEGIAVANIAPDKELVFVTNYISNTVSVVNTLTFDEIEKIDVGLGPIAVAVDPPVEGLLRSRSLNVEDVNILRSYREKFFNVYVVNQNSNDISVLRMNILTNQCEEVTNIKVEWNPIALTVDNRRGKVFVANYGSDKVSVIDILQIVKGNITEAVSTIDNVGTSIIGIISDTVFDRIYLLKEAEGEIMIIRPFEERFENLKTTMPPIMGVISVESAPRSFILDPEARNIYVVNRGSNNISVVDKTTKKEEQIIPVGNKPYGIAIFQN